MNRDDFKRNPSDCKAAALFLHLGKESKARGGLNSPKMAFLTST